IGVSDFVFLPVNVTNNSPAGTVSCWVRNYGSDALAAKAVRFDFYMAPNAPKVGTLLGGAVWIGGFARTVNLAVNQDALIILTAAERQGVAIRGDLLGMYQPQVTVRHLASIIDPIPTNNTALGISLVTVKTNGPNSAGRSIHDYDGDSVNDRPA
ncbi:MAG: hypothetical protein WCQ90_10545, partial [Deltaproteobacteria bacterium]